jgi:ABC-type branched-subunit amino acid transport system permease subunit
VGRLTSLPLALVGGLGLGIFIALFNTFLPRWADDYTIVRLIEDNISQALPFVVLFAVLVFNPAIGRSREIADPLSGVDPPPPSLAAESRPAYLTRATRIFAVVFFSVVGYIVYTQADARWLNLITQAVIVSTIFLSITVMTGLAGQISLCQGAFAAIGGFTVFQLADRYDLSVLVGAVIGAAVAAVLAAVVSLPVRRLGGIWVAIATLAFAYFFDSVMVKLEWIGGGDTSILQGTRVPRPVLGPWDFSDDRAFLVLSVIVLAMASVAVILIRGGTVGSTLQALRGSELAAQSIGISVGRARLIAFAVSGFLAGLGGAMLSIHQENVNYTNNFTPYAALFWLVLVVTLGSRTVEGAIQAGVALGLFEAIVLNGALAEWIFRGENSVTEALHVSPAWRFILFGLGTIQFARHPEGLVENGKRQAARRTEAFVERWRRRHGTDGGDSDADVERATAGVAS